jgi:hypothetical protein
MMRRGQCCFHLFRWDTKRCGLPLETS